MTIPDPNQQSINNSNINWYRTNQFRGMTYQQSLTWKQRIIDQGLVRELERFPKWMQDEIKQGFFRYGPGRTRDINLGDYSPLLNEYVEYINEIRPLTDERSITWGANQLDFTDAGIWTHPAQVTVNNETKFTIDYSTARSVSSDAAFLSYFTGLYRTRFKFTYSSGTNQINYIYWLLKYNDNKNSNALLFTNWFVDDQVRLSFTSRASGGPPLWTEFFEWDYLEDPYTRYGEIIVDENGDVRYDGKPKVKFKVWKDDYDGAQQVLDYEDICHSEGFNKIDIRTDTHPNATANNTLIFDECSIQLGSIE